MTRRSKQTYSQRLAGVATVGMPAPVRAFATSRGGARFLLLLVPILLATGILTVSFSGGLPQFSVNRERAEEVGRAVSTEATRAAEQFRRYEPLPRR
jgi:hypothetical protein